ncbi:hypothetical protein F5Y14DRAFT_404799 [Nemania sp. NC0429]|nr:hypothetical protein F5Y14DRAFT_404799 [Nemania sp. NC0429]
MNTTSPSKRRALAPVDANTRSPLGTPRLLPSKLDLPRPKTTLGTSPTESSAIKRPIEQENDREATDPAKRQRLSGPGAALLSPRKDRSPPKRLSETIIRPRSISPEEPSIFDNSTIDNSQVTVISEPDAETSTAPAVAANRPRQGSMTREEARKKAEILRLRLGLAGYKVRTNQADVPLERLQVRPLPTKLPKQTPSTVFSRSLTASSRKDEERRLSAPAIIKGASSSRQLVPTSSPPKSREPDSAVPHGETGRSPIRSQESEHTQTPAGLHTPQRTLGDQEGGVVDNEVGGAAEGLLSLSQSSPASVLR